MTSPPEEAEAAAAAAAQAEAAAPDAALDALLPSTAAEILIMPAPGHLAAVLPIMRLTVTAPRSQCISCKRRLEER